MEPSELEPLSYPNFLCDVNIEYSPGGHKSCPTTNRQSFKLKQLPYLITPDRLSPGSTPNNEADISLDQPKSTPLYIEAKTIDVSQISCAFLGNSDFAPKSHFRHKKVVIELISARLSQSSSYNVPINSNTLPPGTSTVISNGDTPLDVSRVEKKNDDPSPVRRRRSDSIASSVINPLRESINRSGLNLNDTVTSNTSQASLVGPASAPATSSKRFVSYTILIRTVPGLDKYPTVIERRFSDFSLLYHGLRNEPAFADHIGESFIFPKKVLIGNFSLPNIGERGIEFSRLLHLCMINANLLWSAPFVSFLLDKELKEAHRISLFGDPDDVQASIETAYHIEQKVYFGYYLKNHKLTSSRSNSSISFSYREEESSLVSVNVSAGVRESNSGDTSLSSSEKSSSSPPVNTNPSRDSTNIARSSSSGTTDDYNNDVIRSNKDAICPVALNKRILVTFSILFFTLYRANNNLKMKQVLQVFEQMISTDKFINGLGSERYYSLLKACLSFLLDVDLDEEILNQGQQYKLSQQLNYINRSRPNPKDILTSSISPRIEYNSSCPISNCEDSFVSNEQSKHQNSSASRLGADLVTLISDRDFCSFHDNKLSL